MTTNNFSGQSLDKNCGVCSEFKTWKHNQPHNKNNPQTNDNAISSHSATEHTPKHDYSKPPLDYTQLGNSTWGFLHTMSVYYSSAPSTEEKQAAKNLIKSLSLTYPCKLCADDLKQDFKDHEIKVDNKKELSNYLCELHNRINLKLNKPTFDCSRVFERWLHEEKPNSNK